MHPRIKELMTHLDAQRHLLQAAFDEVPRSRREESPGPGRWSVAGIIEHLSLVEDRVALALSARIAAARAEGLGAETSTAPVLPAFDLARVASRTTLLNAPEAVHPTGLSAADAWEALERAGGRVRTALRSGEGLALGKATHPHPVFGPISIYEWFAVIGSHEARHAAQIREMWGPH